MKKQRFHYTFSGYRWAPESFRVGKATPGQPPKDIPLTAEERHTVGILFLTKGYGAAAGYVKHIERARERQRRGIMTYGFYVRETPGRFLCCPQLTCRSDASLEERLRLFKKVRAALMETGGHVAVSAQCELHGAYRPQNVKENTVHNRPQPSSPYRHGRPIHPGLPRAAIPPPARASEESPAPSAEEHGPDTVTAALAPLSQQVRHLVAQILLVRGRPLIPPRHEIASQFETHYFFVERSGQSRQNHIRQSPCGSTLPSMPTCGIRRRRPDRRWSRWSAP